MTLSLRRRGAVLLLAVVAALGTAPAWAGASAVAGPCGTPDRTRAALRDLTAAHGYVGVAVELAGRHCGRWSGATGVADLRTGRPMAAGERIRIGSTTKTFTATVVLQLA